jgi:hypothetical protein
MSARSANAVEKIFFHLLSASRLGTALMRCDFGSVNHCTAAPTGAFHNGRKTAGFEGAACAASPSAKASRVLRGLRFGLRESDDPNFHFLLPDILSTRRMPLLAIHLNRPRFIYVNRFVVVSSRN